MEINLIKSEASNQENNIRKQQFNKNTSVLENKSLEKKRNIDSKLFTPIEELIKAQKLKPFQEQLFTNISNLAAAYAVSDVADALKISPFLNLPSSFAFMHLLNKGNKNLDKLAFTSLTGVAAIAFQKSFKLPKWLLKTMISSAIFTINNKKINLPLSLFDSSKFKVTKKDIIPLLKKFCKIETVIHTVPNFINPIINWANKKFVTENDSKSKYAIAGILYILKVLGLSSGFTFVGNFTHKLLQMSDKKDIKGLTEMLVSACPAEIASSTKAILLPENI
jgi:hypothetical protein